MFYPKTPSPPDCPSSQAGKSQASWLLSWLGMVTGGGIGGEGSLQYSKASLGGSLLLLLVPLPWGGKISLGLRKQKNKRTHWNTPGSSVSPLVSGCLGMTMTGERRRAGALWIEWGLLYPKTPHTLPQPSYDHTQAAWNPKGYIIIRLVPVHPFGIWVGWGQSWVMGVVQGVFRERCWRLSKTRGNALEPGLFHCVCLLFLLPLSSSWGGRKKVG